MVRASRTILIKILLLSFFSEALFGWCACFYLEYPNDGSKKIMENMGKIINNISFSSAKVVPFTYMMNGAYYKIEEAHVSSVKNVNMGLLENREGLKLMTKSVAQREMRKNIYCNATDVEIALAESKIMYLEQLLLEVSIESNKRIAEEKKAIIGE